MKDFFIREATVRTPRVELDPNNQTFLIEGESYPEDINRFYDPILDALEHYFSQTGRGLRCAINLNYFNSSSARQLMEMLDKLDARAKQGHQIQVKWSCVPDDDIMQEFAEDIASEVKSLQFLIETIDAKD